MKDARGPVLVTGGAGFIGSHVCETLVALGRRVHVLDDFSSGSASNLAEIRDQIQIPEGTIESPVDIARAIDGCSSVVHLAARTSVAESMAFEHLYRRTNVDGTANVLAAARTVGVARVVFAASSSAYGDHAVPHRESMEPRPLSPYAMTKLEGEQLLRAATRTRAIDATALRLFNVFGARQDPNSAYAAVIPRFMTRIAHGMPAVIFGDGEQTRDFIHVSDVARAIIAALDATHPLDGASLNIGTGVATSIRRLATAIGSVLGRPVALHFEPAREGEVRHSVAATALARECIGFTSEISLEAGLATMV